MKGSVSRRYARALYELLDPPAAEQVREGLMAVSKAVAKSEALRHVVASPAFGVEEKMAVFSEVSGRLGFPDLVKTFLRQLIVKNRMNQIDDIAEAFGDLVDETKGARAVTITAASAIPDAEQRRLQNRLRDLLQGDVTVTYETDPRLVSGLRVRVGSLVYDSSLQNRLSSMRTLLAKE